MTTVVITAAGDGTRWQNHTGVPKHLAVMGGERLLDRTVRLAREHGATRVVVCGPDDDRYRIPGAELHVPPTIGDHSPGMGATKFLNTQPFWSATARTVILYGDVWFSTDAMSRIMRDTRREWLHWCRYGPSRHTGRRHGECFAISLWPEHRARYRRTLDRVASLHAAGVINRSGGWEVARAWYGIPDQRLRKHVRLPGYQIIDDFTDDIDRPGDYDEWVARWEATQGHPTVSVLVPWRPDGGHRDRAWQWVRRQYTIHHPDWEIITGGCPDGPWVKAAAVADALTRARGNILVVADADCWTDGIGQAVTAVRAGSGWAVPHGKVRRLTEAATAAVIAGTPPTDALGGLAKQPYRGVEGGGLVVLPRHLYERVPLDPRFHGWGSEDRSWGYALTALAGRPWRGVAPLVHLWHEPAPRINGYVGSRDGRALEVRYEYALKDGPAAMRALVGEITAVPA